VFCLHHHQQKSTVDPLDLSQWTFYILSTVRLNDRFGLRKSVTLADVQTAGALQAEFGKIGIAIRAMLGRTDAA
jgi:hypothetical protein